MKHILLAAIFGMGALGAGAQLNTSATPPRYGQAVDQDNTGRRLTYGYLSHTDVTGSALDTVLTEAYVPVGTAADGFPNTTGTVFDATVYLNVHDSCVFAIKSAAYAHVDDRMTVVISNTASSFSPYVYFYGYSGLSSQWQTVASGTKLTMNAGKNAVITFRYDGTYWEEVSRCVH